MTAAASAPVPFDRKVHSVDVTEGHQHTGLGRTLLLDALARIARASEEVPARAVLAATLDGEGQGFYRHFGFQPSRLEPDLLMVPMRSVRRVVGI